MTNTKTELGGGGKRGGKTNINRAMGDIGQQWLCVHLSLHDSYLFIYLFI